MSWNPPLIRPGQEIRGSEEERRRALDRRSSLVATNGGCGVIAIDLATGVQVRRRGSVVRIRVREVHGVAADGTVFLLRDGEAVSASLGIGDATGAKFDVALCRRHPAVESADQNAARTIELVVASADGPRRDPRADPRLLDLGRFEWREHGAPALRWLNRPTVLTPGALRPRDADWTEWTAPLRGKIETWLCEVDAGHAPSARHAALLCHLARLAYTWPQRTIAELAVDLRLAARLRSVARALGSSLPELLHPEPLPTWIVACRDGDEQISRLIELASRNERDDTDAARQLLRPDEVEWGWVDEDSLWVELRVAPEGRAVALRLPDLDELHERVHVRCDDAALDRDVEARRTGSSMHFVVPHHRLQPRHRLQFSGLRGGAHRRPDPEIWIHEQNGHDRNNRPSD